MGLPLPGPGPKAYQYLLLTYNNKFNVYLRISGSMRRLFKFNWRE